ncbi:MAG: DUF2330 domain-containing protein [bacterium]|nr:DUF2330 domain-containing protein [bacterium]
MGRGGWRRTGGHPTGSSATTGTWSSRAAGSTESTAIAATATGSWTASTISSWLLPRTVRLPANLDVPVFVKNDFADFYRDMFTRQVERENQRAVFLRGRDTGKMPAVIVLTSSRLRS